MSAGAAAPERRPRLNPFAFPSDTAFRFGLLVAAVLGANLYVWQWIASTTRSTGRAHRGRPRVPRLFADQRHEPRAARTQLTDRFSACTSQLYRYQVWWMLGGTAALLLAAAAIMVATPLWITRRRQAAAADGGGCAGRRSTRSRELAREQGLDPPRLFWNPLDPSAGGLAFGHPGRYSVAIGGGLVVKQVDRPTRIPRDRPARARAHPQPRRRDHVLHARDLVRVPPRRRPAVRGHAARRRQLSDLERHRGGWLVLALLVYLTRNAVLRSREVYADLRASVPDGPGGALRRVLAALPRPKTAR